MVSSVSMKEQFASPCEETSGYAESMLITDQITKIIKVKIMRIKPFYCLSFLLLAQSAFANGETPVGDGIGYFINAMFGETGIAIATVAVMLVGLLCLGHFLKWIAIFYTIAGIGIIFGAEKIVKGILALIHH
jgi:type IV secretory pathway VirB2 component (pilin)